MGSRWGAELECVRCGLNYRTMVTGYTFAQVRSEMWSGSADPHDWRYRRRGGVLGYWHQIKRMLWEHHVAQCVANDEVPF